MEHWITLIAVIVAAGIVAALVLRVGGKLDDRDAADEDLRVKLDALERNQNRVESAVKDEIARNREESGASARQARDELSQTLKRFGDTLSTQVGTLTQGNEQRLERLRQTLESKLTAIQQDNERKLEQMRATVDEKLQSTLEKRLGESFKLVSDRLERVHQGLGEMQNLAAGVGDLKKVLTNVKTRGTWGEFQLGNLLEDIFTPDQYETNVSTKPGSRDRVEFAIKLPGRDGSGGHVWLPVDSKFPQEDYQRLLDAQEAGDADGVAAAGKALEARVKAEAKDIREKYIDPPHTTHFGILYLPTESLYAEVLRRPGLFDALQRDFAVTITGPTTMSALVNSLQMGFRTLAIEKRSSEVWKILGVVKTEFGKFGELLDKTHKKLQEASNTIEGAARKSRTIETKLRKVQELPADQAPALLASHEDDPGAEEQA